MSCLPPLFKLAPVLCLPLLLVGCRSSRSAVSNPEFLAREGSDDSQVALDGRPDHLRGLDDNGRIPKVPLPDDLPHPERWRYKPEGRISDKGFLERFLMSSFIAPFFFFESDVGTGIGVAMTDLDFRNQRRQEFANASISYTTEGEQSYRGFWKRWLDQKNLPGGGVIQEERSFVEVSAGYRKTLTKRFFGMGPETKDRDETSYSEELSSISARLESSFPEAGSDWVASGGLHIEHRNLGDGFVSSVPITGDIYPELIEDGDSLDSLWISAGLRYDTRDSQSNPYRGALLSLWTSGTPWMTDGRSGALYGLRSGLTLPLPSLLHSGGDRGEENPPTDVLAFVFDVEDSSGDLPFWALPTLGGPNRLRGYVSGRFVDNAAWFFGSEYRFVTVPRGAQITERIRLERFGMALFYELGSVAAELKDLPTAASWYSYGVGGRINMERAATFRADYGIGRDSAQFTLTFGLSF